MSTIETREDWWELVDARWSDLYNILVRYVPGDQLLNADNLRLQQDDELASLLEQAWANAPDSPHIHHIPSWHTLCDLCSESYVLYEENNEVKQ